MHYDSKRLRYEKWFTLFCIFGATLSFPILNPIAT